MKKNNDTIERYVYACTKSISKKSRDDVAKELEALIYDMLDERCGEIEPTEKDIMVVLTEIGQPYEVAEKYDPNGEKSLISPPYYSGYVFVLKIVIACVLFGITAAHLIMAITEPQAWYVGAASWLASLIIALFAGFGFVTLIFAIFERKGVAASSLSTNTLSDLPSVPKKSETISKGESIVGIVFSVIFLVVFLAAPSVISVVLVNGEVIPIFNAEYLHSTWYMVVGFAALCIINESFNLMDGRYTTRVMLSTIITNTISAVLAVIWLGNGKIINPKAVESLPQVHVLENFNIVFLGVLILILVAECAFTIYRTIKANS